MTIKEIKNYIDNVTFFITSGRKPFNRAMMKKSLNSIKVMLEALEIEQGITVMNEQLPREEEYMEYKERVDEDTEAIGILEALKEIFEEAIDDYDAFIEVAKRDGDKSKEKGLKEERMIWKKRVWVLDVAIDKIEQEKKEELSKLKELFGVWEDK